MDPRETGHAHVIITERMLENLLQLPKDVRVVGIYDSPRHRGFLVGLEGDRLPYVEDGCETPRLQVRMRAYEQSDLRYVTVYDILLNSFTDTVGEPEVLGHIGVERDISDGSSGKED